MSNPGRAPYGCWSLVQATEISWVWFTQGVPGSQDSHDSHVWHLRPREEDRDHMPPSLNLASTPVCLTPATAPYLCTPPGPDCFDPCLSPIAVIIRGPITLKWGHSLYPFCHWPKADQYHLAPASNGFNPSLILEPACFRFYNMELWVSIMDNFERFVLSKNSTLT